LVAVVTPEGECVAVNASFESVLGLSRRRPPAAASVFNWFEDPQVVRDTVDAGQPQRVHDQPLRGPAAPSRTHGDAFPVHAIVNQIDGSRNVVVEWVEIEQQARQDREERALEQAQATKELIRNSAHEIKNPLGGIRGAAQLLGMEGGSRGRSPSTPR
jgi:two-component system nitrogen regulation sensor histidine kinase GlnL